MNNDKMDKPNEIDKSTEVLEEKMCSICGITEKEAISKFLNLVKLSDVINKKYNKEFNINLSSILPKSSEIYICDKCVETTNKAVEKVLNKIDDKDELNKNFDELRGNIESFEDYISSSAHLFKLDQVTVMQSCLNVVMSGIKMMSKYKPELSKELIKTAIIELERELQKLK